MWRSKGGCLNFGMILRRTASVFPNRVALRFDGQELSYVQLYERSCRLVNALRSLGVSKGDRVCTLGDNSLESLEEFCGLALGGFVRSPMYTQNPVDLHLYMLDKVKASVLIVQEKHWREIQPRIGEAPSVTHVLVKGDDYDALLQSASSNDPQIPVAPDDIHQVRWSGGTTGTPKGIVHTTQGWLDMGNELALALHGFDDRDRNLVASPLSHAAVLMGWPLVAAGATQIVMPSFDPGKFLELVEKERVTCTFLAPTMVQMAVNHPDASKRNLSSLRFVLYAAAPIAERTLLDAIAVWGNINWQVYGQSEGLPVTVMSPEHHVPGSKWLRSAGRPTPNSFVKILDDDDKELPPGEIGEITCWTPGKMLEIWGDAAATAERFAHDGWVRTRDLGYVDTDGFVYLSDRKEDMIISGGFNIWPAEVENALYGHPAVLEAMVVSVPHDKWGETPLAVVVLRDGQQATESELIEWCRDKVGPMKKPTRVDFRTEPLPKNPIGKLLRRVVRDPYWEGHDRRVAGA
jgi:acyl-CoA synthetase (AMP-forming)/AMP-acid ligase II